jgi:hypothetical protein
MRLRLMAEAVLLAAAHFCLAQACLAASRTSFFESFFHSCLLLSCESSVRSYIDLLTSTLEDQSLRNGSGPLAWG